VRVETLKVSLREHVDQRFKDFDRRMRDAREADRDRVQLALTSAKEAVDKAEQANERRLGLLNEFRSQQADEARKYVPRETYELGMSRVSKIEEILASLQGRAIALAFFGTLIGGAAVAAIMRLLDP
jgi:vacuolar-type H+-ATPase subunit H